MATVRYEYVVVRGKFNEGRMSIVSIPDDSEAKMLKKQFSGHHLSTYKGMIRLTKQPGEVVNYLGRLGYKVISTTNTEGEVVWTMQKEI
ncbi:uncharacterized protein LOC126882031 [Diabrotica virgifera virgifera]|uniref:Uncharacterized protein LOC114333370 n=1 Tax=Diabrotica virgifera virgifera TaxID=50390 RepID=A0A6P7G354_DIAVI|nr:uncharacterized protein LOC126882031 [Diabrotica virgifera virgifera]